MAWSADGSDTDIAVEHYIGCGTSCADEHLRFEQRGARVARIHTLPHLSAMVSFDESCIETSLQQNREYSTSAVPALFSTLSTAPAFLRYLWQSIVRMHRSDDSSDM